MTRFLAAVPILMLLADLASISTAKAASDTWKFGLNGNWETGGSWTDGTTPTNADSATLGFASTYTVTFGVAPVGIQNLTVNNGGTVTFTSSGGVKTLNVTAAGPQSLNLVGPGTTLNLGTSGNPMNLNLGADLSAQNASTLQVLFGSHVTANDFSTSGLNGTIIVNGAGSLLTLGGSGQHQIGIGGTGTLNLQNGSAAAAISGSLGAGDAGTAGNGSILMSGNSTISLAGNLTLATQNVAGSQATLSINGTAPVFTQTGGSYVGVGSLANGTATINIATTSTGGMLSTGGSGMAINPTGSVNVGGSGNAGTLNVNGTLNITGGGAGSGLTVASGSTFNLASGATVNITSGGQAAFGSNYTTAANAVFNISGGAGLKLSKLSSSGAFLSIANGAQANLSAGGQISAMSLNIADNGSNGTLTVDGAGSSVTATSSNSQWGLLGGTATVTFKNGATGTFNNGLQLAPSLYSSTANLMVQSGSHLNAGFLSVATAPDVPINGNPSAIVTVTDANSSIALTPNSLLTIGDAFSDVATVTVQNGANLTVGAGGSTSIYAGSTLNINGGTVDLKTLNYNGGTINFSSGALSYLGNLTVGIGGLLGSDLSLGTRQVTLSGATTIDPFHTLTLNGGRLNTGSLVVNGTFNFNSGTLGITGPAGLTIGSGGPLGSVFTLGAGRNLNVSNTTYINSGALLVIESGGTLTSSGMTNQGELLLDGPTAVANGAFYSNLGLIHGEGMFNTTVDNPAGGEIRAEDGKRLKFQAANTPNLGQLNLLGGTLEFTQPYTNGATGQILGRGTLKVGGTGLVNLGNIALASGVTDIFGDVNNNTGGATKGISISGNAAVNFWDDVTNTSGLFKVNSGSTATFFGTFSGLGITGNASDIHFEADISPGFSPASINLGGNVSFGAGSKLKIELGGTTPGTQYDQVHVGGNLSLDGTLQIALINNFTPALGNTFDILDWGTKTGTFSSIGFPMLPTGLMWDSSQLYLTGVISVIGNSTHVGDFNHDGHVNAADIPVMMAALADLNAYKSANSLSNSDLVALGDVNGDGGVSNADVQALLDLLKSGGGSLSAVPEPSSVWLAAIACLVCGCCRHVQRRVR